MTGLKCPTPTTYFFDVHKFVPQLFSYVSIGSISGSSAPSSIRLRILPITFNCLPRGLPYYMLIHTSTTYIFFVYPNRLSKNPENQVLMHMYR